ncbi:hypothetical protein EON65_29525 [archaeon]|nr:MAG: hypothetical protein EON65_29525 [archaeon]
MLYFHDCSNTDPFAVLYLLDRRTNSLVKHGTTVRSSFCILHNIAVFYTESSFSLQELIKDNRSPHWATSVQVDYMFELIQEVTSTPLISYHTMHIQRTQLPVEHFGPFNWFILQFNRLIRGLSLC